jgi:hypothetical protein
VRSDTCVTPVSRSPACCRLRRGGSLDAGGEGEEFRARGRGRSGAGRSERVRSQPASPGRSRACPRVPARPKMYPSHPRGGSAFCRRRQQYSPLCRSFCKPSEGLEPSTPPYHGTSQATGCSRWQRIWLGFAVSACRRLAVDCRRLQPRGSVTAPSGRSLRRLLSRREPRGVGSRQASFYGSRRCQAESHANSAAAPASPRGSCRRRGSR